MLLSFVSSPPFPTKNQQAVGPSAVLEKASYQVPVAAKVTAAVVCCWSSAHGLPHVAGGLPSLFPLCPLDHLNSLQHAMSTLSLRRKEKHVYSASSQNQALPKNTIVSYLPSKDIGRCRQSDFQSPTGSVNCSFSRLARHP